MPGPGLVPPQAPDSALVGLDEVSSGPFLQPSPVPTRHPLWYQTPPPPVLWVQAVPNACLSPLGSGTQSDTAPAAGRMDEPQHQDRKKTEHFRWGAAQGVPSPAPCQPLTRRETHCSSGSSAATTGACRSGCSGASSRISTKALSSPTARSSPPAGTVLPSTVLRPPAHVPCPRAPGAGAWALLGCCCLAPHGWCCPGPWS